MMEKPKGSTARKLNGDEPIERRRAGLPGGEDLKRTDKTSQENDEVNGENSGVHRLSS